MSSCLFQPWLLLLACQPSIPSDTYRSSGEIPVPNGYTRVSVAAGSFGEWLRQRKLKTNNTVYLYNGEPKRNQGAQFAVLDISTGSKDLQQCADAAIRLYAEYLYGSKQYDQIVFNATDGTAMDYKSWRQGYRFVLRRQHLQKIKIAAASASRESFDQYLEQVFSYAGTLSLSRQLKPVRNNHDIKPGDMFVQGGSPGHAVIVMDVAINTAGEKIFMLAQSYMPAQDMHILKNPRNDSPWYPEDFGNTLLTPEWTFQKNTLYSWK